MLSPHQYRYERNIHSPNCQNLVAVDAGGSVVGYTSLLLDVYPHSGPEVWRKYPLYIGVMAVSPEWQNRGVGTRLLERQVAESRLSRPQYSFIHLEVDPESAARRLYERLGFEKLEVNQGSWLMRRAI
ncbi:GNAT family N-acetyltransferase [Corallococcus macrosporus]|uniref:GNAT family N-acetyltransferase n=1 Tax=Corallococcus macrosporus TaxID=35 RepID=UPI003B838B81